MKSAPYFMDKGIKRDRVEVVQINLGNRCNQTCTHCHIAASPRGSRNMKRETAERILNHLTDSYIREIEFTGGAPELNPNLQLFIEKLSLNNKNLAVRTNLTVLDIPDYSFYVDLYKQYKVKVISSLPGVFEDTVDKQRGKGTFETSLKIIKRLNYAGYSTNGLVLDLVYNPSSDYLPPDQRQLEEEYREILRDRYGVSFNNLMTIVNAPIRRFKGQLQKMGKLYDYIELLKQKYNPDTLENIMCRHLISVDYEGNVYDCDFNLALNKKIKGYDNKRFWEIDFNGFNPEITFGKHCLACTANTGSSCHGVLIKNEYVKGFDVKESIKNYYGKELQRTSDLKTDACCTPDNLPESIRKALLLIDDEIKMKYYGCGSPIPLCIERLKILDVGCGTGRDVYIMSQLAGKKGFIFGMDMTDNQINIAKKHLKEHTKRFGYMKPNVKFIRDYIENIEKHLEDESLDLVTSNCVINLAEDKEKVLSQIYRVLKYGGEFYFSDIYADRRSPDEIRKNPVLYDECLGGSLYIKDFDRIARRVGFIDPRIVSKREVGINNTEIKKLIGNIKFYSITYRLWKLKGLEDACEDFGHIAIYKGGIEESPFKFDLDGSHVFYRNMPEKVCGNTALMLSKTRFGSYFQIIGSFDEHFGEFKDCSNMDNKTDDGIGSGEICSCC